MRTKLSLLFLLIAGLTFSQTPKIINYQGVARDAQFLPVNTSAVGLYFEIIRGNSSNNGIVYTQSTTVQTNSLGLFSTQIGSSGGLDTLHWNIGTFSLKVSIDTKGG